MNIPVPAGLFLIVMDEDAVSIPVPVSGSVPKATQAFYFPEGTDAGNRMDK